MTNPVLRVRSPIPTWGPVLFGVVAFLLGLGNDAYNDTRVSTLIAVSIGLGCTFLAWPRDVEIGVDGVRVRGRLGMRGQTIPYRAIRLAAPDGPKRLVIRTMTNETFTLHGQFFKPIPRNILDRFWSAISAGAEDGSRGAEREKLARSGRSIATWRVGLRELSKPSNYRQSTVSHERLWSIAENPGLDHELRAGAIVALSASTLDASSRDRLRRIDATTVDPALHALLDHAANGGGEPDDQIVDAALEGIRNQA